MDERLLQAIEYGCKDPQTDEDKDALIKYIPALIAELRRLRKIVDCYAPYPNDLGRYHG